MASRRRVGVAVIVDPPLADELDGLRRGLGDPALGRLDPHVTLVPPINLRASDLGPALQLLRKAAASLAGPLDLTLEPPATFLPDNPVLYLPVGDDLGDLRRLRDAVFAPPLERVLSWPWTPHVTLADGVAESRIRAALDALDRYRAVVHVERLVLLEQAAGRIWAAVADAALGPARIVGRGGLAVELTQGRLVDPEGCALLEKAESAEAPALLRAAAGPDIQPDRRRGSAFAPIVFTARRQEAVVAVGAAWRGDDGGHVAVFVRDGVRRQGIGSMVLAHLEDAVHRGGWACPTLAAHGPAGFYGARSRYSKGTEE
ncbi:MAG: GNAT family N-acetyltransferase [Acidimicrobiales bacterium]